MDSSWTGNQSAAALTTTNTGVSYESYDTLTHSLQLFLFHYVITLLHCGVIAVVTCAVFAWQMSADHILKCIWMWIWKGGVPRSVQCSEMHCKQLCWSAMSCHASGLCLTHKKQHLPLCSDASVSCVSCPPPLCFQDRASCSRHYPGHGGTPHCGSVCAERRLQVLCRSPGLH